MAAGVAVPELKLAGRIKALRHSRGETQEEFCLHFEKDQATISDWEREKYEPEAQHFVTMGKLAPRTAEKWYFWGLVGLDRADVLRAAEQAPAIAKAQESPAAVPILRDSADLAVFAAEPEIQKRIASMRKRGWKIAGAVVIGFPPPPRR